MSKFTPGPWRVHANPFECEVTVFADAADMTICFLPGHTEDLEPQDHANAQLIAAAPAMLEALEALSDFRQAAQKYSDGDPRFPWITVRDILAEWADKYDEAIATARGETP